MNIKFKLSKLENKIYRKLYQNIPAFRRISPNMNDFEFKQLLKKDEFIQNKNKSKFIEYEKHQGILSFQIKKPEFISKNLYPRSYSNNYFLNFSTSKKYLYIYHLEVQNSRLGLGTKLLQEAVKESFARGCKGRIILTAASIDYGKTYPLEFYYLNGFKAINKKINKLLKKWIKNKKNMPEVLESAIEMYLPKKNIKKLLKKQTMNIQINSEVC